MIDLDKIVKENEERRRDADATIDLTFLDWESAKEVARRNDRAIKKIQTSLAHLSTACDTIDALVARVRELEGKK